MRSFRAALILAALLVCVLAPPAAFGADEGSKPAAKEGADAAKNDELKLPPFPADKSAH